MYCDNCIVLLYFMNVCNARVHTIHQCIIVLYCIVLYTQLVIDNLDHYLQSIDQAFGGLDLPNSLLIDRYIVKWSTSELHIPYLQDLKKQHYYLN